ncbi:MAG: Fic family protein [Candidatus Kerfeldbacteria bacterium]|nr:Fic family protein [Candidatus Kerfeldbacteria bacterium]
MNTVQKLQRLLATTQKTQTELASLLGVSFATLNSWVNGKSIPRKNAQERIDTLYQEYTGYLVIENSILQKKKGRILEYQKEFPNPLKVILSRRDTYDAYILELTYHTNSIEGSTFTEPEVRAVLFDNVTIPDKTLIEHQEAKNHQAALGQLFQWLQKNSKTETLTEERIQKLHAILMNGIRSDAGMYRRHGVRIVGSHVATANYLKVPDRIFQFIQNIKQKPHTDLFAHMARTHAEFEQIHPFADGNGRVGRLIMHAQALQHHLPPVLIQQEKKQAYYTYLQHAQLEERYMFLESFICDGILESYRLLDDNRN